jgi:hypothetical protein
MDAVATALASSRSISELAPAALCHVGKTADWVAITTDAVSVNCYSLRPDFPLSR